MTSRALCLLCLVACLTSCAPPIRTTGDGYIEFEDPGSDFVTSEVFDVGGDSVAFREEDDSMVFGELAQENWPVVEGLWTPEDRFFEIRFGSVEGEPRAFITERVTMTVCDVALAGDGFTIYATETPVPND
jgi:hypothetical protein